MTPPDTSRDERRTVLYITNQFPQGLDSGGQRREYELLRRLAPRFTIHLLVIHPQGGAGEGVIERGADLGPLLASLTVVELPEHEVPTSGSAQPARIEEHHSPRAMEAVRQRVSDVQPDLVHVEGYFLMYVLPEELAAPIVLAEENVEYQIDAQRAAIYAGYDESRAAEARELERSAWQRASVVCAVTPEDEAVIREFRRDRPVHLVPNASDHFVQPALASPRYNLDVPRVGFLGNYRWFPTYDAAVALIEEIWPALYQRRPEIELILIGEGGPQALDGLASPSGKVQLTGWVDDLASELQQLDVFLCPLRVGGGSKFKVTDAIRSGCAIITTPIGADGLPDQARQAMVIVEDLGDFPDAILALLDDDARRHDLQGRALRAASTLYQWDDAAERLSIAWQEGLEVPGRG